MSVSKLAESIVPPIIPLDTQGDWEPIETDLGITFPDDYKAILNLYGSGAFFWGYLSVFNPLTEDGRKCIEFEMQVYRALLKESRPSPYPLYPDRVGLFPWGRDENGGSYFWLTNGEPDNWPVVYLAHGYEGFPIVIEMNVSEFLRLFALNEIKELAKPDDPINENMREFTSGRSQAEIARNLVEAKKIV